MIPRDALADLVGSLAGLACVWASDDQPQLGLDDGPQAWLELDVSSVTPKGTDEYRQSPNPKNPDALLSRVVGYRNVVLTVRAHSYEKTTQPYQVLEDVRSGLGTRTAQAFFLDHNVAPVRTHPIVCTRSPQGHRTRLDGTMDIELGALAGGVPSDDDGATIATVNGGRGVPFTPIT